MMTFDLKYGNDAVSLTFDESRFEVLGPGGSGRPLSDAEIGSKLESPVGSNQLEEVVSSGGSVLIAVPDATRQSGAGQVVNLLMRRLIASGIAPYEIAVIFATGIHQPVTSEETEQIITPFVAQRTKTLNHAPRDLMRIARVGETKDGIPVELNRALLESAHVITVGSVGFHYFAGFTGGRKLICPGLASSRTIAETHKLAFDFDRLRRAEGVGVGKLGGNPVHEAFVSAAGFAPPAFSINTIVDEAGRIVELTCGDWEKSHLEACETYSRGHSVRIEEKRDAVLVSCGGHPYDINLIQAHKALEMASHACADGGQIIFLAECADGIGRRDFLDWFEFGSSKAIGGALADGYKVNGQTAWSLKRKTEKFDVRMVTSLSEETTDRTGIRKMEMADVSRVLQDKGKGYVLPFGALVLPVVEGE